MRLVLALGLLLPLASLAAWRAAGENEESIHYVDWSTLKRAGDTRRVWTLIDMKDDVPGRGRSQRSLIEFDCKGWRWRYLQSTDFSGPMAAGNATYDVAEPTQWRHIAPGSIGEINATSACSPPKASSP